MRMDIQTNANMAVKTALTNALNPKPALTKSERESDISKAAATPRAQLSDQARASVKERIEAIKKRLMILKKLFASDPKQMAKALAQVFKELKAALKDYKAASDQELGSSRDIVTEVMTPPAPDTATKDDANPNLKPEPDAEKTPAGTTDHTAAYGEVMDGFRKMIGEDSMAFAHDMRGLVNEIEDKIFNAARIQMKAKKPEKDMDEAFKDAEDSLKDLRKSIEDMQSDIRREVPDVGMRLSVAA